MENTKALEAQKEEREVVMWTQVGETVVQACDKEFQEAEKAIETVKVPHFRKLQECFGIATFERRNGLLSKQWREM